MTEILAKLRYPQTESIIQGHTDQVVNGDDDGALQAELDTYLDKIVKNDGSPADIENYTRNAQAIANVLSSRGTGSARARVVESLSKLQLCSSNIAILDTLQHISEAAGLESAEIFCAKPSNTLSTVVRRTKILSLVTICISILKHSKAVSPTKVTFSNIAKHRCSAREILFSKGHR